MREMVTYRHQNDTENKTRFLDFKDSVPPWASDIQPHVEESILDQTDHLIQRYTDHQFGRFISSDTSLTADLVNEMIRLKNLVAQKNQKIEVLKEDLKTFVQYRRDLVEDAWFSHKIFDEIQQHMDAE